MNMLRVCSQVEFMSYQEGKYQLDVEILELRNVEVCFNVQYFRIILGLIFKCDEISNNSFNPISHERSRTCMSIVQNIYRPKVFLMYR